MDKSQYIEKKQERREKNEKKNVPFKQKKLFLFLRKF